MESRSRTSTVGAVALVAALGFLVGLVGPALQMSGWLGWLIPPALFSTVLWLVSLAVLVAAARVLLTGRPQRWVTVALAFIATSALLELDSLGFLVSALVSRTGMLTGWSITGLGSSVVLLAAGVLAVLALPRDPSPEPDPRTVASVARIGAIVATAGIAVAAIALPHWYDDGGRGFGSALQLLREPGGLDAPWWPSFVAAMVEPVLAVVAVALVARRDLWLGVVAAVAMEEWGHAAAMVLLPARPLSQTPAVGSWVILAGFGALVALLFLELRRGGPEGPRTPVPAPPDSPDAAVPADVSA